MMGIAKEVSIKQARKTGWKGTIGILTAANIKSFVNSLKKLMSIEEVLYKYVWQVYKD